MPDFIPSKDADLLAYADNMSAIVTAGPLPLGLTAAIATALAGFTSVFSAALAASTSPATRGSSTVLATRVARRNLVAYIRQIARTVQGTPTVTDVQKHDLGLTVRDTTPSPIGVPTAEPGLEIVEVVQRTAKIRLWDTAETTRRGKPVGVAGAAVFSYVGATAPTDPSQWKFEGNTMRTTTSVEFPSDTPSGATVYLCAFWFNPRGLSGPACSPVQANLPGGIVSAAA